MPASPRKSQQKLEAGACGREVAGAGQMTLQEADDELRKFDLCVRFGPFLSLSRQERWQRAHALGLAPPALIPSLLETFPELTESTFAWQNSVRAEAPIIPNSLSALAPLNTDTKAAPDLKLMP